MNYEKLIVPTVIRKKGDHFNLEEMSKLFEKPLLHRQVHGDEVYVPLDTKRLWGF
ncbi:hypothetical protein [Desertibacillus haloalkaliphilus]|uniref:hypothetical protein n=1 Tax=Desertibacillus haloalkaliphilus TaxID=1328930 RepID=UPI001C260943|nr:hypothetical protein [Desertibacillus haloalkaliphilus]MBU8908131.1 hypothetical protein [Desertibacillus haloalkaliphilus]